jgi:hypothetical protein
MSRAHVWGRGHMFSELGGMERVWCVRDNQGPAIWLNCQKDTRQIINCRSCFQYLQGFLTGP